MPYTTFARGLLRERNGLRRLDYYVPYDIDQTGTTDVSNEITDFINSVPKGTASYPLTIHFQPDATYRIDYTIAVKNRNYTTFDGNGCTFQTDEITPATNSHLNYDYDDYATRSHWRFRGCTNIRFTDAIIRGANANAGYDGYDAAYYGQHAVDIQGSQNVTVDNLTISKTYGDWFYIGPASGKPDSQTILIENNTTIDNGRQGLAVSDGTDIEFRYNTCGESARSMIDLESNSNSAYIGDIRVHDNTFGPHRLYFLAVGSAFTNPVEDVIFTDNECEKFISSYIVPVTTGIRNRFHFENMNGYTEFGTASECVYNCKWVDDITIINSSQVCQAGRNMHMARFNACTDFTCTGNTGTNLVGQYFEI